MKVYVQLDKRDGSLGIFRNLFLEHTLLEIVETDEVTYKKILDWGIWLWSNVDSRYIDSEATEWVRENCKSDEVRKWLINHRSKIALL